MTSFMNAKLHDDEWISSIINEKVNNQKMNLIHDTRYFIFITNFETCIICSMLGLVIEWYMWQYDNNTKMK
jgi:hypothetical protein